MDAPITEALPQAFIVSELQLACPSLAALPRHVRWSLDSLRHTNECLGRISTPAHATVGAGPRDRAAGRTLAADQRCVRSYPAQIEGPEISGTRDGDHRQRDSADVAMQGPVGLPDGACMAGTRQLEMNEPRRVHASAHGTIDGSSLG
jgi:hypothetical protein